MLPLEWLHASVGNGFPQYNQGEFFGLLAQTQREVHSIK